MKQCGKFLVASLPLNYYLVANLAAAELINSLCHAFILVYLEKESWIFGEAMCIFDEPSSGAKHVCDYKFLGHNRLMSLQSHFQQKKTKSFGNRRHYQRNTDHGLGNYAATFITRKLVKISENQLSCSSHFPGDSSANYNKYSFVRLVFTFAVPYFVIPSAYIALTIKLKLHVQRIDKEVDDKSNVGFSVFIALNGTVKPYGVYRLDKRIDNNTAEPEERKKNLQNRRRNGKMVIDTAENHLMKMVLY